MPASPYATPRFYDIAFGWRDIAAECDFMEGCFAAAWGRGPQRVAELACGPGRHARQWAARAVRAVGIDQSPPMIDYAKSQPGGDDPDVRWQVADMRHFTLDQPVELACCLMDSLSHLLTLDELLDHLAAVARNVVPGGLYVLEQSHPRDAFASAEPGAQSAWSQEDEDGEIVVHTTWGQPDDPFDFATQIGLLTVTLHAERDGATIFHESSRVPSRLWMAGEMDAAIRAADGWALRDRFGAMDRAIPWQSEPPAWRMVSILQRTEA